MTLRRTKFLIYGLAVCLLATSRPVSAEDDPLRHGYALIIGVWEYKDSRWPRIDDIKLQIQQLQTGLSPNFDSVQVLQNPSYDKLDANLREFLKIRGNDSKARLFIYYAGHGYTEADMVRNSYRGYISGVDIPSTDGTESSYAASRVKAISMEEVRSMVSDVNARQVLFVFDSCFSGTIFAARSPSNTVGRLSDADIAKLAELPVREFITAGDITEKIPAHSPVPQLLLNAINGAGDPYGVGVVTGQQIAQYLWSQTRDLGISPREGKLPGGYFDQGEFLFRAGLSSAVPAPLPPKRPAPVASSAEAKVPAPAALVRDKHPSKPHYAAPAPATAPTRRCDTWAGQTFCE